MKQTSSIVIGTGNRSTAKEKTKAVRDAVEGCR